MGKGEHVQQCRLAHKYSWSELVLEACFRGLGLACDFAVVRARIGATAPHDEWVITNIHGQRHCARVTKQEAMRS